MRHLLMDPAFPDIVGEWASQEAQEDAESPFCANDNHGDAMDGLSDPLLSLVARAEIEATRLW
jgi:hypothetical protein